ncbi:MAG: lipoate--protein ligase family protein [Victivallales bacterium]|nr:lipoate--protein ligase family protein [Victivallales bacterium]
MDTPRNETWFFWDDNADSPAMNMAADEALLVCAQDHPHPVLRFYQWDRPAVSIGLYQTWNAAPKGLDFVRRPTGGGVVFHDYDFTYSVAAPPSHWLAELPPQESYAPLNQVIQRALQTLQQPAQLSQDLIPSEVDRATMVCFQHPTRYDVLANGRKVAGAAQRRTPDGLLHQGSLHFGTPLPFPRNLLQNALLDAFHELHHISFLPFEPSPDFLSRRDTLAVKYGSSEWNLKR